MKSAFLIYMVVRMAVGVSIFSTNMVMFGMDDTIAIIVSVLVVAIVVFITSVL